MKKVLSAFTLAFILNLIWENLHASLYAGYRGGPITEWILVRATFWDAVIVSALCGLASFARPKVRPWLIGIAGLAIAIGMEKWALATQRWVYAAAMPTIPIFHTGLTPTIQLTLTALAAWYCIWYSLDAKKEF